MALVEEPKQPGVYTFTWAIHNFSHCNKKKDGSLFSPVFYVGGSIPFKLVLYPKGCACDGSTGFMSLHLHSVNYKSFNTRVIYKFVLSLKRFNGIFKDSYREVSISICCQQSCACRNFISIDELNETNAYLENDVLTLRCRVWRATASVSEPSVDCFAKTEIKIAKLNYLWILEDLVGPDGILKHKFERSTGILNFSSEFPTIKLHVSTGETFDDDSIYLAIEKQSGFSTPLFSVYNIHLLDSYGSIVHFIRGEAEFQNSNETQKFPFMQTNHVISFPVHSAMDTCKLISELYLTTLQVAIIFSLLVVTSSSGSVAPAPSGHRVKD
ncbi:hypothetical protein JTE90_010025 [Oedothorax gibbosus]|uniref:MATH domain-containing protein n=1 Tax=Oedothorax gibbosus TaxID=931172 RepID=A0AAV6TXV5_9ARAC|nr:hypothetical protein JTE90_010025 [Oedothorax gibbosus]